MKVRYTTANRSLTFELDAPDTKSLFDQLAHVQEIFEQPKCEACKSENLGFSKRKVDKFEYREIYCKDCSARLSIGQQQDGHNTLFPNRKDQDGNFKGNYGWHKWSPSEDGGETVKKAKK